MKKKVAFIGVFLALALIVSYVETFIPNFFGIPGIKLGLANIVMICVLYCVGAKEAYLLSIARVFLAGFLFGNMYSIIYSLAGAMLSLTLMLLLKKITHLKIVTVSVIGGISHNVGQLIVAILVVSNYRVAYYMPALLIAGFITGLLIGLVAQEIIMRTGRLFHDV